VHVRHVLQVLINPHRIKDGEALFVVTRTVQVRTQTRSAPEHLLEQDAATHAPDKHQIDDFRHIDTCGQQINRDGDLGQWLILIAADKLGRLVSSASDLLHGVVRHGAIVVVEGFLQQTHNQISV
jgi:hypothetical protein